MSDAPEEEVKRQAKRRAREVKQVAKRLTQEAKRDAKEAKWSAERRTGEPTDSLGSSWVERLGRLGYATKGAVYAIVGALALAVAIGAGGQTTGPSGALETIGEQPFGLILLVLITVGLAAYAFWRLFQAVKDPDREGSDARGIAKRIGHAVAALAYLGLAFGAGQLTVASGGGGGSPQD